MFGFLEVSLGSICVHWVFGDLLYFSQLAFIEAVETIFIVWLNIQLEGFAILRPCLAQQQPFPLNGELNALFFRKSEVYLALCIHFVYFQLSLNFHCFITGKALKSADTVLS